MTKQIFVCGTGRSGTTILTKLLGCHPDVWAFRWESQVFAGTPGLGDVVVRDFSEEIMARFRSRVSTHMYRRNVRGAYDAGLFEIVEYPQLIELLDLFETAVSEDTTTSNRLLACRRFTDSIFLPPAIRNGAVYWCEKTPRNLLYADMIAQIYPDAKFINVVRDGRDVTSSILEKGFWPVASSARYPLTNEFTGPVIFDKLVTYWTTLIDIARTQEATLGNDRWLNVRLEDITANTRPTFERIYSFIKVEPISAAFDELTVHLHAKKAKRDRWKKNLTADQVENFTSASYANLQEFGYM